jgi:hypothetical protein
MIQDVFDTTYRIRLFRKYLSLCIVLCLFCLASADVLPEPVPENQVFTTSSTIEGVSIVSERTSVVWEVGDAGLTSLARPKFVEAGNGAIRSGSIAYVTYADLIATNGGQISEVKSFSMDTHEKTEGLYNIETTKVLTYTSQNGSHLMGAESYLLDIAGNWSYNRDDIVCVFARANDGIIPAFCNKVTASSKLTSVTTAQVESVGGLTAVARSARVPAALKYEISVTPDANSASGYAEGIVSTIFTVSVMEGRSDGDILADIPVGTGMWTWVSALTQRAWKYITSSGELWLYRLTDLSDRDEIYLWDGSGNLVCSELTGSGNFPPGSQVDTPGGAFASNGFTIVAEPDNVTYTLTVAPGNILGMTPGVYTINTANQNADGVLLLGDPDLTGYNELAATLTHIDTATVAGGITTFTKEFNYQSGITCTNC